MGFKRSKNRKLNRKSDFDYSEAASYFITIQTKEDEFVFGTVNNSKVILSDLGEIAEKFWLDIETHFDYVELDAFVVMPDHFHGFLHVINDGQLNVGTNHGLSLQSKTVQRMNMRLPNVIKQYKSSVTREINKQNPNNNFKWQRSYHDRILRNDKELQNARNYIEVNPVKYNQITNN